jgi:CDP-diacylglycerol--serine O-phosphatidyltransferase
MLLVRVAPRRDQLAGGSVDAYALPDADETPYSSRTRRRRLHRAAPSGYPVVDGVNLTTEKVSPVSPAIPAQAVAAGSTLAIPLLPGEQTLARRVKFAVANGCTVSSLLLGMLAIFLSMHGNPQLGGLFLIGCVVFDGLDGALARKFGVASPFGAQMDSLADMCSFGIAAPVVVYASLRGVAPAALTAVACAMVAACAAIRLARFNVSPRDGRYFTGVPTTMVAAVLGISAAADMHPSGWLAVVAVVLLAVAMVSSFPYAKLARLAKLPPWLWLGPVLGSLIDYQATFALVVLAYLVSGPLLQLRRRQEA